ncbi:MAG TPA: amidohydrolase family protein [Gemmatimonadales bacterium]|nr:amidohydrolase family protein [Gemmatimonadales bacterium]
MAGRSSTLPVTELRRLVRGAALLALLASGACTPRQKDRIALVGGNVISGSGGAVLRDAVIMVHKGKIETVTPREGFDIPRDALSVDVSGSWIIPGLIDGHAHTERWALLHYVAAGVTTVRDMHGQQDSILALREEVSLGGLVAPRIYSAGAMIDGAPATYPTATEVHNADQARRAVDARAVAGVDYIKVYTHITPDLLRPIMDEAGTFNLKVAAHLGLTDALTAAHLGVTSIEHLSGVPEAVSRTPEKFYTEHRASFFKGWTYFEKSWAGLDSVSLDRVATALVAAHVTIVPTLVLHETYSRLDDPAVLNQPDLKTVPDSILKKWNLPDMIARAGWSSADYAAFRASRPNQDLFVREFRAAGGRIVAGTDASNQLLVPGLSLHSELELLVAAGLTPQDALATATRNAAELLGADSLGEIAPGKVADLVVLGGNPLANIRNTRLIQRVMVRGQLYRADSLRAGF